MDRIKEYKEAARKRYYNIAVGEKELFQNVALLLYHTTADGLNYHIVEIDKDDAGSDDIGALLEWSLHNIVERTDKKYVDEMVYKIMGAIPIQELDASLEEAEEYVTLDLGYVIPGLIEYTEIIPVENEYPEYIPSATAGDYSPSCPWNAPGMSISDFI